MKRWRRFSAARLVFYVVLTPVSYLMGWLHSVTFVSLLSLWALIESGVSSWRSDVPNEVDE
jgi:hypothetical protein